MNEVESVWVRSDKLRDLLLGEVLTVSGPEQRDM